MKNIYSFIFLLLLSLSSFGQDIDLNQLFTEFNSIKDNKQIEPEYLSKIQAITVDKINNPDISFSQQKFSLERSQYFIVVDANPRTQNLFLAHWDSFTKNLTMSSTAAKVATGEENNPGHFISPVGWFEQTVQNGSFRAQGTKNEKGILGYGAKGMRIWDLGWQKAQTGWLKNPEIRDIRLQMHATDPNSLEQRLGKPDSKGCIRIPAAINKFIDLNSILDFNFSNQAPQYFVLNKNRNQIKNQGSFILIINTTT